MSSFVVLDDGTVVAGREVARWVAFAVVRLDREMRSGPGLPDVPRDVLDLAEAIGERLRGSDPPPSPEGPVHSGSEFDGIGSDRRWVTVRDAARILGCTDSFVCRLARSRGLRAERQAGAWRIDPASVEEYRQTRARQRPA